MSTRSQIRFTGPHEHTAQVYNHSDGYPESVVEDIRQLFDVLTETGALRGAGYTAANFVFFGKLRQLQLNIAGSWESLPTYAKDNTIQTTNPYRVTDPEEFKQIPQTHAMLGYGIEESGTIHGDEEYLYDVVFDADGNVGIRVSEQSGLPKSVEEDGGLPDSPGWSGVSWQYDGSLTGAVAEFVSDDKYDVPEVGDVLHDPKSPVPSDYPDDVEIIEIPGEISADYELPYDVEADTPAEANPDEPADAPVVLGEYVEEPGTEYAFPVTRLEKIE